jgi:hypothetical protein
VHIFREIGYEKEKELFDKDDTSFAKTESGDRYSM